MSNSKFKLIVRYIGVLFGVICITSGLLAAMIWSHRSDFGGLGAIAALYQMPIIAAAICIILCMIAKRIFKISGFLYIPAIILCIVIAVLEVTMFLNL